MKPHFPKSYPLSPIREIKELQEILFKKELYLIKVEDVLEDETETFSTPKSYVSHSETDNKSLYILPLELPPPQISTTTEITETESILQKIKEEIAENNEIIRIQVETIDSNSRELKDLENTIMERNAIADHYMAIIHDYTQKYYHNEMILNQQIQ